MKNPDRDRVIRIGPEQTYGSHSRAFYKKGIQSGEFVALGRRRRRQRRNRMHRLPLAPDLVGVWRHVGDGPVHIPESGVAAGFVE